MKPSGDQAGNACMMCRTIEGRITAAGSSIARGFERPQIWHVSRSAARLLDMRRPQDESSHALLPELADDEKARA
jgi:hypothetical protein